MRTPTTADLHRLAAEQVVWLCTLRPDGSPHLTPVWFCYLGESWWISSASRNVKVANLAKDPRVSLALTDGDRPVVAEGTADFHHGTYPDDVTAAFVDKYGGWDITDHVTEGPRVLIRVRTRRWLLTGSAT